LGSGRENLVQNPEFLGGFGSGQFLPGLNTGDVVLRGKQYKNVYKVCISSLLKNKLTCLSALNDDIMLWHKRLGHASLSLLNK